MSLALTANTQALSPNAPASVLANGGTPPYTYVVLAGGPGGSINATTGEYIAPSVVPENPVLGFETIQVTDALSATALLKLLVCHPLMLVCDILQKELGLAQGQVYLWDQKINIPIDEKLYIAVGILTCKPFSNTNRPDGSGSGLDAIQSVNMMATLSIDILSRGPAARDRKEEVILALQSDYAQAQQEINSFYVGKISTSFANLSQIDGSAIPYRFNISVNMQYTVRKSKAVPYFDTFDVDVVQTEP